MKRQWIALAALLVGGAPLKMAQADPGYEWTSSTHYGSEPGDPDYQRIESGTKPEGASWDIHTHVGATAPQVVEMAGTINAKAYGLSTPESPSEARVQASDGRWASSTNTWQWNPDGTNDPPSNYSATITSLNGGQMSASVTGLGGGQYKWGLCFLGRIMGAWNLCVPIWYNV